MKAACAMAGVADMTLTRWRRQHPDFDAEFKKATEEQTWYDARKAIRRAGFRTYERKPDKHPRNQEKALRGQINDSEEQYKQGEMALYEGLPVRFGGITEDKSYIPCVSPSNGRVEYLKRENGRNV